MNPAAVAMISGAFALTGGLGGALLAGFLTIRANKSKQDDEDSRRWQSDRRKIYAQYLGLLESMVRQSEDFTEVMDPKRWDEDSELVAKFARDASKDYLQRWQREVEPTMFEIQLMASPKVADLAVALARSLLNLETSLNEQITSIEFEEEILPHYWREIAVLRNAMRNELNLPNLELANLDPVLRSWYSREPVIDPEQEADNSDGRGTAS